MMSEEELLQMALTDQEGLVKILTEATLRPGLLTFAAEMAGELPEEMTMDALEAPLAHPSVVVREGALIGIDCYDSYRAVTILAKAAESNGSATIEAMAAELWQDKVVGES